ncbi:MAG: IS1634 family transposase [Planctomycetota bacterium]
MTPQIRAERVDDLPILLAYAKEMGVAEAIDRAIPKVHGNRTGLSYGHVAWGFLASIGTQRDHRLNIVEGWSTQNQRFLEQIMGQDVGEKDFTDDRLADLLWELGDSEIGETIEEDVGRRMVGAYRLPAETGRADTTSVSVYHDQEGEDGLLRFGKSKNHRPDLRQFIQVLGTLDPAGIPLTTSTLPGNRADDGVYWPTWQRMTRILGRTDWVYVGDSKLHSAENLARIARAKGYFLTPIPMKGNVPEEFDEWLKSAPKKLTPVRLPDAKGKKRIVGYGFEVERDLSWTDPETGEEVEVTERVFVVRRESFRRKQIHVFRERLEKAEEELRSKNGKRVENREEFKTAVEEIVERRGVDEYLSVKVSWESEREEKWEGRGRPGPNRKKRVIEHTRARVSVRRRKKAIAEFEEQAGWRAYGTNVPKKRMSLQDAVEKYAGQWQPERGFHMLKGGMLKVAPIFLRTERHIRGLLLVASMALRLLMLVEFVTRRNLSAAKETLTGLYDGLPKKATDRPTAERLLRQFDGITLITVSAGKQVHRQLQDFTAQHKKILKYMGLPTSVYTLLESG